MMGTHVDDNRARLINMANGGDGRVSPWIEIVTIRRSNQEDTPRYILHVPGQPGGREMAIGPMSNIDAVHGLFLALKTGAKPRDPDMTDEQVMVMHAAIFAGMPPPEDHGRVIEMEY